MEGAVLGVDADPDVAPPGLVRGALRDTWTSLRSVFGNPALRRIEAALATSMIGDWAYATAVVVWAYGVGGARLVGIWMAVRYVLMAIVSPIGASLADRLPRKAVLIGSDLIRALLATVAGIALLIDAPAAVIIVIATILSAHRLRVPPGPDGLDAVPHPPPRGAHRGQRRVQHDREPGLLPRPGPRGPARDRHQRAGRVPPQRGHLPRCPPCSCGASTRSPVRPRATRTTKRDRTTTRRGRACSPRWPAGSGTSPVTATWSWSRSSCAPRPSWPVRRPSSVSSSPSTSSRPARRASASSTRSSASGRSSAASTRSPAPPATGSQATSPWAPCCGRCRCS